MNKDEALSALEMIESVVSKAGGEAADLRRRADDLYMDRVAVIAKQRGCSDAEAHARAAADDVASRAYALSVDLAECERRQATAAGRIAAYVG